MAAPAGDADARDLGSTLVVRSGSRGRRVGSRDDHVRSGSRCARLRVRGYD